jgi:mono/diheme cytochrome c family protein
MRTTRLLKSGAKALAIAGIVVPLAHVARAGGDTANGQALAQSLFTGCHVVTGEAAGASISADVPTFSAIAKREGQTAERIAGRIVLPHPPMPQVQLSRDEIADLSTYIMSLKSE